MPANLGKAFEKKFREDFSKLPGTSLDRLYDVTGGLYGVRNICDFIGYKYPNIFYLEIKSHYGNTFPLSNLTQYEKLVQKQGIQGVRTGVILWFIDHDRIIYVPIKTITKLKNDDKKSINIKKLAEEGYDFIDIPSIKKRTFMDSDYSVLFGLEEGW